MGSPTFAACLRVCAAVLVVGSAGPACATGTYSQLHAFTGGSDGAAPWAPLTPDGSGNIYGANSEGGSYCSNDPYYGCGVIYKVTPSGTVTNLYNFTGGANGFSPETGITVARGMLFGASFGGTSNAGILYSMNSDGSNFTVMHEFNNTDGLTPAGKLQTAGNGGFYGVTVNGGPGFTNGRLGDGVLFFVLTNGKYKMLHKFLGGADGSGPNALLKDTHGNVFGSTYSGGSCAAGSGCGVIFEYSGNTKAFSVLYTFHGTTDGRAPKLGGIDSSGTLYGAADDGQYGHGTLFSLTPSGGTFAFKVLASFPSSVVDGQPLNPPTLGRKGDLVGATTTFIYRYANGIISNLASITSAMPADETEGPFLIGPGEVLYGTNLGGGITPCTFSNSQQNSNGCGFIFSLSLH